MNNAPKLFPQEKQLAHWYRKGFVVPYAEIISGAGEAWTYFRSLGSSPYAFFLDSVKPLSKEPIYSYFGQNPFLILRKKGGFVFVEQHQKRKTIKKDFISTARDLFSRWQGRTWKAFPHWTGGALGSFGYGLAWDFEKLPHSQKPDLPIDDAYLLFVRHLFVYDHANQVLLAISNLLPERGKPFQVALKEAKAWIRQAQTRLETRLDLPLHLNGNFAIQNFQADIGKRRFKQMVSKTKRYIEAGDIYQANLSQRFSFDFSGNPEVLYQNLRDINPSPFASFIRLNETCVVSASPERLVRKTGMHCETRPIAGTRPRGRNARENNRLRQELWHDQKERAEHIMLVDLERNDLGRVCQPNTVRVNEMMVLEEYSHVIHLVSNVIGELCPGKDQFDLLKAMFPGGTITGCPKIRCMEIIDELEPFKRGLYTGSIGYLDFNGNMDLNIVIRTIVIHQEKGFYHVGAGVVYDSDQEAEYWETMHKGQALVEALKRPVVL